MRVGRRGFVAGAAAVGLAGRASRAAAPIAAPIKVGVCGPFTGGLAAVGAGMRDGARLAAAEVNEAGGVLGRPLSLLERDDEARNEAGVKIARELVKERVSAALGYANTGVALASQRYYQDAESPVITNVATGTVITRQFTPPKHRANYVFRISASDAVQSAMIAEEALVRRGFKRPAILSDSTLYGQIGREDLERALAARGVAPAATERFDVGDVDMTAQLVGARRAGADVVLAYAAGPELARVAGGMAGLGWKAPMIGAWTLSMPGFIAAAGPNGEGASMPQTFVQVPNTPKRRAFIEAYRAAYKVERIPAPVAAAQGYDSVLLLAAAIEQAGGTDGRRIKDALEDLAETVEGVVTVYDRPFTATDHEAITADIPVFGVVRGGRVVPMYEADVAGGAVRVKARV